MKNVHLLPTDRPSGLFKDIKGNLGFNTEWTRLPMGRKNQHIYIISDEDVEVNDAVIDLETNDVFISKGKMLCNDFIKKIILTDNKDLIKDGVQAINDDFLEWFIKNPSCEYVEIELFPKFSNNLYGIIIPKQETLEEAAKNETKIYINEREKQTAYLEFINGAKWQSERMYSEEEVLKLLYELHLIHNSDSDMTFMKVDEWFEQHKKK